MRPSDTKRPNEALYLVAILLVADDATAPANVRSVAERRIAELMPKGGSRSGATKAALLRALGRLETMPA